MNHFIRFVLLIFFISQSCYAINLDQLKSKIKTNVKDRVLNEYPYVQDEDVKVSFSFSDSFKTYLKQASNIDFNIDSVDRFLGRTSVSVSFFNKKGDPFAKDFLFITVRANAFYVKAKKYIKKNRLLPKDNIILEKESVYGKPYNSFNTLTEVLGKEVMFNISKD